MARKILNVGVSVEIHHYMYCEKDLLKMVDCEYAFTYIDDPCNDTYHANIEASVCGTCIEE